MKRWMRFGARCRQCTRAAQTNVNATQECRAVGEGGVGADQQRASSAARELIDGLPQMSEAFGPAAADGGRSRERTPALPLLDIGAARGFARRRGVLQINRNGTGRTRGGGGVLGQG